MAENNGKKQEISLEDDFDAVVRYGGTTVELKPDGNVTVKTNGNAIIYVDAYTKALVRLHSAANSNLAAVAKAAKPGDRMPDGTVYAGISPDTHKPIYATPKDASLTFTFK